jgi:hypothetical protein
LNTNPILDKILGSPQPDGKNFKNILSNLDLLEKKPEIRPVTKFENKHLKYKRVLTTPKSYQSENEPDQVLKKCTKELLNKNINPDDFREILRNNGINPYVEGINKVIRQHESGQNVKFNDMLNALIKNRQSKFDPRNIQINVKKPVINSQADEKENGTSSMIPLKNGSGQMIFVNKKRPINFHHNSLNSNNKELFDWELSTLNKIKSGELNPPGRCKNESMQKVVFDSNVFINGNPELNFQHSNKCLKHVSFLNGTGDIFTWKGDTKESFKTTQIDRSDIKRRDPNQIFKHEEVVEKKPVKLNKMLYSSAENALVTWKK